MITATTVTDIPVVFDAIKTLEDFPMIRCNYLSIECDSPGGGWKLSIGDLELPFLMLGLVGIITSPFGAERFNNVGLIEDLFEQIEDKAGLLIDVDDIWLPIILFRNIDTVPKIGDVFRIIGDVFALALSFREGRLDLESFLNECEQFERPMVLSEEESLSFQKWHDIQIDNVKEHYPKNKGLELPWHEE